MPLSLSEKWSMRKICSSSKISCTAASSFMALARSVPNAFFIITWLAVHQIVGDCLDHVERGFRAAC